jgi:hypothetical protein
MKTQSEHPSADPFEPKEEKDNDDVRQTTQ